MKSRLGHLWAHHKFLFLSFALALAVTLFFAIRTTVFFVYWSDPSHRNQPLEPWMTLGYVATSYDVQPEQVLALLGMSEAPRKRLTLKWIATRKGVPVETLITDLTRQLETFND